MKIKELLTINLAEDIKNVIDLEDISEAEIRAEIENYIVTDGLAQDYSAFVSTFTSKNSAACFVVEKSVPGITFNVPIFSKSFTCFDCTKTSAYFNSSFISETLFYC